MRDEDIAKLMDGVYKRACWGGGEARPVTRSRLEKTRHDNVQESKKSYPHNEGFTLRLRREALIPVSILGG